MVLFDEDPVTLIRETTNQFHIAPDRDSLTRIGDSLSSLSNARQSRINHQQSILKSLSRRLNGLEEGYRWEEDRHDAGGHAERMLRMDTEKFRIAKDVSNTEIEEERLEAELASCRSQLEVLDREGVEGGRRREGEAEDEVILKLHLYRSLGITADQDSRTGEFHRAVVRRRANSVGSAGAESGGDVSIIDMDEKRNPSFYSEKIWDAL